MRNSFKSLVKHPEVARKRVAAVNIKRRAYGGGNLLNRDILAKKPPVLIPEIVHNSSLIKQICGL
jgi:hypothetical protein